MEDTAPLRTSTVTLPPLPRTHGNAPDNATIATDRRSLLKKRAAVIVGLLALTAGLAGFCVLYGPELLAFVADAPRFRAWVDETGWISRIVFVLANMAQVVFAFLPGEPLELGAGYAFGFWEGTLWCLVASALGTAAVMALVRAFGIRIVGLFFSPDKITSMRWLRDSRRFEMLLFLCFLIPGTPKDLLTYVAGLGSSSIGRIVAITTVGRIPSIVSSTLAAGAFGDGNYLGAALVIALTAVLAAAGTVLTNKYAEGYPGKRYYGGCQCVDVVEDIARKRACQLFGADHANVQPHCGANANYAVYAALCEHGDTVLGMDLANGGHLTHGSPVNFSGKNHNIVAYGVNDQGYIDYDQVRDLAKKHRPRMLLAGASAYPRTIDFKTFADIAHEVGAYLFVDMAHIAGLVAAGLHPSPIPYADVVTTTTHKTLRGPRGGMILCNKEAAEKYNFNKAIFPGIQGGPLMHVIAAKAVCFKEALSDDFKVYQQGIIDNAQALCKGLMRREIKIVSGGTDNHLMLVDLTNFDLTGKAVEKLLDEAHITCNKNTIPNDPKSPFVTSGIRLGTPAVTSRGMNTEDMDRIAEAIALVIKGGEAKIPEARAIVQTLTDKYPLV